MTSWTFGGTAMTTYGKVLNVDYLDTPGRRGDNTTIPFQDGERHNNKYYEKKIITFEMALSVATAATLESTVDSLKAKISVMGQQTLAQTMEDTTVRNISATVDEIITGNRITNGILKYMIVFKCASPFFRLSTAIADNTTTINANPKAMTVTNPGTVRETRPTIILTGPLQNTVITNSTNGCVLTYTGTIASPRIVTLSFNTTTNEWVATDDLGANKISLFSHSGDASMFVVDVGNNTLSIADSTHTTGTVKITFNAPYL